MQSKVTPELKGEIINFLRKLCNEEINPSLPDEGICINVRKFFNDLSGERGTFHFCCDIARDFYGPTCELPLGNGFKGEDREVRLTLAGFWAAYLETDEVDGSFHYPEGTIA